jgi:glucokinase
MSQQQGTIGIDIGGTKTLFVLFDDHFKPLKEIKVKTEADKGEKHFTKTLEESLEELLRKARKRELHLAGVGIGSAGHVNFEKGTLKDSPNIPFLTEYPLRENIAKLTGASVHILNDCHAGLYGEHQLGAAMGLKDVIGIFMGTGLGGAVIIDGKLFTGANGYAGDIGHYLLSPVGPLAGSDRHGILDDIASRTAIAGEAATLAAKQWAPHLAKNAGTDVTNICSNELAESIKEGDKSVEELVRSRAKIVGIAVSNLVDFLNPEMLVLGGGMVEAMGSIIKREVEEGIRAHTTEGASRVLKVSTAKLKHLAVAAGAAKMSLDVLLASSKFPATTSGTIDIAVRRRRVLRTNRPKRMSK